MKLAKQQKCILLRSGIQIWIDENKINNLLTAINQNKSVLIEINKEYLNTADISGIFSAD
jgi:hypothetical protein